MRLHLRRGTMAALSLFALRSSLFAQVKQPLTFEKFLALQIAADPRPSPDGSTVAFSVSLPSLEDNRNISRVWTVAVSGGGARVITSGPGSDFSPRWSPDGRSVAFISRRSC